MNILLLCAVWAFSMVSLAPLAHGDAAPEYEPTYTWIYRNIIDPHCIGCHGGAGPKGPDGTKRKIYFETWEKTMKEVVVGYPDESPFYLSLIPGKTPELMPLDGTGKPLPDHQLRAVREWILNGAQNN